MKKVNSKFKSIREKLFFTLCISVAIIILVLIFTNSIVLESFYIYAKAFKQRSAFEEINELYNEEYIVSSEKIKKIAVKNSFELLVETDDGNVAYETSTNFANEIYANKCMANIPCKAKKSNKLIYAQDNMVIEIVKFNDSQSILLAGKLDNGYLVYIKVPIDAIQESVKISNNLLIIMGIIILIISSIVASIISKKFTNPILQLNSIANKMANLDFSHKYRISDSDDEINELGKSINKMSDTMEKTIKQLRSNNNQLEKDIEEKSKIDEMRKQFISDVSHELKTPIALIQGYAEGLVEDVNTDEKSRKYYADVILDESNKMDKLVQQLLELMRIEYGKRDFNNEKFDISELIEEVIRKCNVIAKEKNSSIVYKNSQKINVYADEFYMEQAFTNYITNAIKHVKKINGKSEIVIRTEKIPEKNVVRIYVFNTGDNLTEDNLNRIWGRFYKVDESRNRALGGTGIGLSLVKAIMTNYKTEYGVENKENGIEFYFDVHLAK